MGCTNSKSKRWSSYKIPFSPSTRRHSIDAVRSPRSESETCHQVALKFSTLGSLKIECSKEGKLSCNGDPPTPLCGRCGGAIGEEGKKINLTVDLNEAKAWSVLMEERIPRNVPRTPVMTPPGEPETINTWEMMEGLEDQSIVPVSNRYRSFSFNGGHGDSTPISDGITMPQKSGTPSSKKMKPVWLQIAEEDPVCKNLDFDPEILSAFRKSLQDLSPSHPFHLKPMDSAKKSHLFCSAEKDFSNEKHSGSRNPCGRKDKLVVYFTSLRGVRKTFEDCCDVRMILKGLGVRIDERDVSLHSAFKEELKEFLGERFNAGKLPVVFVGKTCIGGAEEIRRLHEEGGLQKLVENCEFAADTHHSGSTACEACGDIRFVPCETCSGSCKVYYEGEEEEEEECGFHRCPDCNENGLIRCPFCCY